jgi:hypothetical protein
MEQETYPLQRKRRKLVISMESGDYEQVDLLMDEETLLYKSAGRYLHPLQIQR